MKRRSFLQSAGLTLVAGGISRDLEGAESAEAADGARAQNPRRRVLITSGHSALARAIADALAANYEVRLTAPREIATTHAVFVGELGGAGTTDTVVEGVDAIVHVAEPPAEASAEGKIDYRTRGTYSLLRSAAEQGVRHIVYLSSLELLTGYGQDFDVTEDWRPVPSDDADVLSHYLGEFTCREFAREGRAGVVVLRLGKIVEATDAAREAFDPLWIDQRDAVQAVTKALHAWLMGTDQLAHPWLVFHVSSRSPQARFTCDRAKHAFAYAPQFP